MNSANLPLSTFFKVTRARIFPNLVDLLFEEANRRGMLQVVRQAALLSYEVKKLFTQ
ncbi:MAG: hypothetical protein IGS48_00645 [Oscillatoriales cyanobacterium C42_A2020_001]|nr:hypothetical protein [Leptolyngbyaceae cyanobacterium C42_A2020_001]